MKKFATFLLFAALFLLVASPSSVNAAKKFVPKKKSVKKNTPIGITGIPAIVRYRGDKQGILMSFSNFNGIDSVSYSFTYDTNGSTQGAGGTITANNKPVSPRELLFGTCSTSVCRYHYNLNNARLTLTAKYTSGRTLTKIYRIKTYQ